MEYIILILIGLFASALGALVGIGGGVIIVPLLIFFGINAGILERITPQSAVGTSSLVLIVIGLSAMISYGRSNQVDMKNGLRFLIGIMPGAFVGSYASQFFTIDSFNLYFGIFLIFLSTLLIIRDRIKPISIFQNERYMEPHVDNMGDVHHYGFPAWIAILSTFIVGFFTGLFGIGGGALMTPLMLLVFRMPASIAIGTSMMMVFFSGTAAAVGHVLQGNVDFWYALFIVPAAFFGAKIGVSINRRFNSDTMVVVLRTVLLLLGVYMILQTII
ncbi:sulfite exporter TauE/SafE family protein [Salinicoccus sp. ID82-1]|uniref:Probable membrane transporter protein n=1 Tax=Salinicoccus cyprini TaxID=2493691 RepID=A0A558AWV9_9STAP|nr:MULTISPECIES: sulfite exporter TauE/SafE family protein [Salinicoccus]MCG1010109.1 sulfite exporter TauE/SafE family protein [Salinicoccus sp. ID82-1]TVT28730.1 sulfite exporter TauE/SafE family protein [Salinicoccus cyprini]